MFALLNRFLNWLRSLFWNSEMDITIVGLQNSGKTTFVDVISGNGFREQTISTVGFDTRLIKRKHVTIKIWEVGGQPRFRSMWERYCRGVNAILFMVDASDYGKIVEAKKELHMLLKERPLANIPLLVLGNKVDLPNAMNELELIDKMSLSEIENREVCCYSISCKNNRNINVTSEWLIAHSNPLS